MLRALAGRLELERFVSFSCLFPELSGSILGKAENTCETQHQPVALLGRQPASLDSDGTHEERSTKNGEKNQSKAPGGTTKQMAQRGESIASMKIASVVGGVQPLLARAGCLKMLRKSSLNRSRKPPGTSRDLPELTLALLGLILALLGVIWSRLGIILGLLGPPGTLLGLSCARSPGGWSWNVS